MQKNLINYTEDILDYIQKIPLSDSTVKYYRSCYNSMINYCKNNSNEDKIQMSMEFLKYQEKRYIQKKIGQIYYLIMRKATYVLIEYL